MSNVVQRLNKPKKRHQIKGLHIFRRSQPRKPFTGSHLKFSIDHQLEQSVPLDEAFKVKNNSRLTTPSPWTLMTMQQKLTGSLRKGARAPHWVPGGRPWFPLHGRTLASNSTLGIFILWKVIITLLRTVHLQVVVGNHGVFILVGLLFFPLHTQC